MLDRIGDRFADGEIDGKDDFVAKAAAFSKLIGGHRRFLNRFDTARQTYFSDIRHACI